MRSSWTRLLLGACFGGAAALLYAKAGRPAMLRWGATEREGARELPGDDLFPAFDSQATRAVTILAPAEQVWPWLMQIGQDRGGFYSYAALENLVGCEMPVINQIIAEWPDREPGDTVWLAAPHRYGGQACMTVALAEPNRALVFEHQGGLWSFVLQPAGEDSCRLIVRTRTGADAPGGGPVVQKIFWEPAHFIMERQMMLRIRQLAERRWWSLRNAPPAYSASRTSSFSTAPSTE